MIIYLTLKLNEFSWFFAALLKFARTFFLFFFSFVATELTRRSYSSFINAWPLATGHINWFRCWNDCRSARERKREREYHIRKRFWFHVFPIDLNLSFFNMLDINSFRIIDLMFHRHKLIFASKPPRDPSRGSRALLGCRSFFLFIKHNQRWFSFLLFDLQFLFAFFLLHHAHQHYLIRDIHSAWIACRHRRFDLFFLPFNFILFCLVPIRIQSSSCRLFRSCPIHFKCFTAYDEL